MPSTDRPDAGFSGGTAWVRIAMQQCRALEMGRALDAEVLPLVGFAIRWAPFGGAGAEELFVKFGVTRRRFLEMVGEALRPRDSDEPRTRQLKRHLWETLALGWRADSGAPAPGRRFGPATTHLPVSPTRVRPAAPVRALS
ncbi:hypothetical protein [Nocardia sp. CA-290969]|uniref:hypothetical protein n=1 Tax=Nocardia sp. CA-290969 TaxID=3239986 RepID=UPI003D932CFE